MTPDELDWLVRTERSAAVAARIGQLDPALARLLDFAQRCARAEAVLNTQQQLAGEGGTLAVLARHFTTLGIVVPELVALHEFQALGGQEPSEARSPQWPRVRTQHLRAEPLCQACGVAKLLQVHHVQPYHLYPALELDDGNLITLCVHCHLLIGHLMCWRSWNPLVRQHCAAIRKAIRERPVAKV